MPAENPFWDFSVKLYGREGVPPACLRLQDSYNADVNILMYCCWVAWDRAMRLDSQATGRILASVDAWKKDVVVPLRTIRRDLKDATHQGIDPKLQERLRSEIKGIELRSERLQQDALFALPLPEPPEDASDARASALENVLLYLQTLPTEVDEAAHHDVEFIVDAIFEAPL